MITNKKHLLFADEFKLTNGLTEDAIRCYQIAYPNTQKESARVKSSKLLQEVTIKKYIQEYKENIRLERENSAKNELKAKDSTNILQREKAIEMVSNVAKLMYNQLVKSEEKNLLILWRLILLLKDWLKWTDGINLQNKILLY